MLPLLKAARVFVDQPLDFANALALYGAITAFTHGSTAATRPPLGFGPDDALAWAQVIAAVASLIQQLLPKKQ